MRLLLKLMKAKKPRIPETQTWVNMMNRSKFPPRLGQVGLQDPGEDRVLVKVERGVW